MIARHGNCDSSRLASTLLDALSVQEQVDLTHHLDHCATCREQLEQMAADASWWSDTRDALRELADTHASILAVSVVDETDGTSTFKPAKPTPRRSKPEKATAAELPNGSTSRGTPHLERSDDHWVTELLSPSDEPHTLGTIDSMPVESVIGQGGMGVVLKARDESLHRFLAVKLLSPMLASTGAARQRFLREAQAAAAIVHPNIVPIYAVSAKRKIPYLVMPFVAGGNLQQYVDAHGPLPIERTLSIGLQIAEGLSAAHRQGIVHRDIKPANLMLDEGGFRVMLTDFGLARALDDATLTGSGMVAGTPQFMSPEQAAGGSVDHRSDIYSLGSVLYTLATGRPPFRGNSTLDVLRRIGREEPPSIMEINPSYPSWFQRLVDRLMDKELGRRPQSAEEVSELMRACLAHARTPHRVPLPRKLRAKYFWPTLCAVALLCACSFIVGGILWWPNFLGNNSSPRSESNQSTVSMQGGAQTSLAELRESAAPASPLTEPVNTASSGAQLDWYATEIESSLARVEEELRNLKADIDLLMP